MPNLILGYVRYTDRISDYVGYLAAAMGRFRHAD